MTERLTVYEPGDKFCVVSTTGEAHVYSVARDGTLIDEHGRRMLPTPPQNPNAVMDSACTASNC